MDNINQTAYNNKYLTNNSSWDLQIIPMEDRHHHMSLQIPTSHNIPPFPNYPLPHSSSSSSSSPSCLIDHLPSSNSTFFLATTTTTTPTEFLLEQQDHHHHHDQEDDADDVEEEEEKEEEEEEEELGAMKDMMYKIAAMQPVDIDPATIRRLRRRNVRISDDPQSVAARLRRESISERVRILQRLVPGGTKMDTASMLDEAIRYVKFLKRQIRLLGRSNSNNVFTSTSTSNNNNHHLLVSPHDQYCPPKLGDNIISSNSTTNIINSPCLVSNSSADNNDIINWGLDKFVPNYKLGHAHNPSSTAGSENSLFAFITGRHSNGGFGEA